MSWQSQEGPPTNALAFSHNNKWLVEGSKGQFVRLYDIETGEVLRRFKGHSDGVLSVAFSPDDKRVISSDVHGTVRLWEVLTGKQILAIKMEDTDLHGLSFNGSSQCSSGV